MTLVHALPVRDLRAKVGSQTGCGGMAVILVDFEPGTAVVQQPLRLSLTDVW